MKRLESLEIIIKKEHNKTTEVYQEIYKRISETGYEQRPPESFPSFERNFSKNFYIKWRDYIACVCRDKCHILTLLPKHVKKHSESATCQSIKQAVTHHDDVQFEPYSFEIFVKAFSDDKRLNLSLKPQIWSIIILIIIIIITIIILINNVSLNRYRTSPLFETPIFLTRSRNLTPDLVLSHVKQLHITHPLPFRYVIIASLLSLTELGYCLSSEAVKPKLNTKCFVVHNTLYEAHISVKCAMCL